MAPIYFEAAGISLRLPGGHRPVWNRSAATHLHRAGLILPWSSGAGPQVAFSLAPLAAAAWAQPGYSKLMRSTQYPRGAQQFVWPQVDGKVELPALVKGMAPGSVIVDLAAERGGNCELTRTGETVEVGGITIIGAINLATSVPYHASQMYARNVSTFLLYMVKEGKLQLNLQDEIIRETMITNGGEVVNARVREFFKMPALVTSGGQ